MMTFQKDFGTTVILLGLAGVLFFVAGLQWRWILGGAGLGSLVLAAMIIAEPYRMQRLTSFRDPYADPEGAGYQVVQGWIALASGGWSGEGLASGVAQHGFLPEAHTDFISAVVGEELGVFGWIFLVALYAILLWRGVVIARRAPDLFGMLMAVGVITLLLSQTLINLASSVV